MSEVTSAIDLRVSSELRTEMIDALYAYDVPTNIREYGGVAKRNHMDGGRDYLDWADPSPEWDGKLVPLRKLNKDKKTGTKTV